MFEFLNQSTSIQTIITVGSFTIFTIGLFGILVQKNLIKIFLSIAIMESSLFLYFIGSFYSFGKTAPIVTDKIDKFNANMVDPVPQAMILTTIVISVAVLSLALSYIKNYHKLTSSIELDEVQNDHKKEIL